MNELIKYKVVPRRVLEIEEGKTTTKYVKRYFIVEEYTKDNIKIQLPSVLSGYLYEEYRGSRISNSKNAADVICPFLNFVRQRVADYDDDDFIRLEKEGLYGLNLFHAAKYLNYLLFTKGISKDTALAYTKQIVDFYNYLNVYNLIGKKHNKIGTYKIKHGKKRGEIVKKNPFKNAPYKVYYNVGKDKKKKKINDMDEAVWQLFLQTSEKFAPDITFGIALQMFGGLRRGEVVNLSLSSVKNSRQSNISQMNLYIENRMEEYFAYRDDVDISKCGVKKTRPQAVVNFNGALYDYYSKHLEYRQKILQKTNTNTDALFIDKDGLPMSGERYEKRWAKVRREFLKVLSEKSYDYYTELVADDCIWGTHICRGIFSNLCLKYGLANTAEELRNWRGDEHIDSSKPYVNQFKLAGIATKALNIMGKVVEVQLYD